MIVPVLPADQCKGCGLSALYPSRRHLPTAVSAFFDLMIEKLNELDALSVATLSTMNVLARMPEPSTGI